MSLKNKKEEINKSNRPDTNWHSISISEVFKRLNSDTNGLTNNEAYKRIEKFGFNELKEAKKRTVFNIFIDQFKSFLILILFLATIFSVYIGESTEAIAIGVILLINALLGTFQEFKAEESLKALKKLSAPMATVLRNGLERHIPSKNIVPGDIVVLKAGNRIPADCRLIDSSNLRIDEAILTGESVPVNKDYTLILNEKTNVAERKNLVFSSTYATYGRGKAVVTETGMNTEVGKIAESIQKEKKEFTPLQKKLDRFGKQLGIIILVLCAIVAVIEIIEYKAIGDIIALNELMLTAVGLAVSAVPEGLPAIVTITLALGVRRMAKRNSIIRRLSSVETLGSSTTICTDKTGTITRNEMTVREIWIDDTKIQVTGEGYIPEGEFNIEDNKINPLDNDILNLLIKGGTLCNDSTLKIDEEGKYITSGEPTEIALTVLSSKAGFDIEELKKEFSRIDEIPFDSARKMMTTINSGDDGVFAFIKGAPERILDVSRKFYKRSGVANLSEEDRDEILKTVKDMANRALRVLAIAYKPINNGSIKESPDNRYIKENVEKDIIFIGLVGLVDPPRIEVKDAVKRARDAGIRTIIVTGDHKLTAEAIAIETDIMKEKDAGNSLTGQDLEDISDKELKQVMENVSVFARVSPEHKLRIVNSLKADGEIVAMTGDGINDAPSVKKSDVGIAMGIRGSDVTREAADMILADDNYATIVSAIEEGRGIFNNIRKFIRLLLSANFDEIFVIFIASLMRIPLPFLPVQILWINLITDSLPALALGMDKPELDLMRKKPRDPKEPIYHGMGLYILVAAVIASIASLLTFVWFYRNGTVEIARTVAFTVAVVFELFLSINCKSPNKFAFSNLKILTENKTLLYSILGGFLLQLIIIYTPFLQPIFNTYPIGLKEWGVVLLASLGGLILYPAPFESLENKIRKLFKRG
jgi:Ca2+-transporting ATPase